MHRHLLGWAAVASLGLPLSAAAQDAVDTAPAAVQEASPAQRIEAAIGAYDAAYEAFIEAYQSAEDEGARNTAYETLYPSAEDFSDEILAAVRLAPTTPEAADGCAWLAQNLGSGEGYDTALKVLVEHHLDSRVIGDVIEGVGYSPGLAGERFAKAVLAAEPSVKLQAKAHMALGQLLLERHGVIGDLASNGEMYTDYLGEELVAQLAGLDEAGAEALHAEALGHFRTVIANEEMSAVRSYSGTLGEQAAAQIFEIENLSVGLVAPDIAGIDSAEVAFKLSDYRGQVVLLDFWGDW